MIFEQEIEKQRHGKWHIRPRGDAAEFRAISTLDDAREFLNSVGFCLVYPVKPPVLAPTFIGAYLGTLDGLPTAALAFKDPRTKVATELMVRLLMEKSAFEASFGPNGGLLIAEAEFPYFYALLGDRNPKQAPSPGERGEKALVSHAFEVIQEFGPVNEDQIRDHLAKSISETAVVRVLQELWSKLRITRVDDSSVESPVPVWDVLYRWAPDVVKRGMQISAAEALSALLSKYLETVVAAEQKEVEDFFSHFAPKSKVSEVIRALIGANEFEFVQVSGKRMLRLMQHASAEEKARIQAEKPVGERRIRPWEDRERGKPATTAETPEGGERKSFTSRPEYQKRGGRLTFGDRKPFAGKSDFKKREDRPAFGDRKPFAGKSFGAKRDYPKHEGASFGDRKPYAGKPFGPKREGRPAFGDRKPFAGKSFEAKRDYPKREGASFGDRKPYAGKPAYESREGRPSSDDRKPFAGKGDYPKREGASFGAHKPFAGKSDFKTREGRPSFGEKKFGERRPFAGKSEFRKREGRPSFGDKKFGERKPFSGKPSFRKREEGAAAEKSAGDEGKRSSFAPKPFGSRSGSGKRPSSGFSSGGPGKFKGGSRGPAKFGSRGPRKFKGKGE